VAALKEEIERLKQEGQEPQTLDWVASLQTKLAKEDT
jgi:hypothetical protein